MRLLATNFSPGLNGEAIRIENLFVHMYPNLNGSVAQVYNSVHC